MEIKSSPVTGLELPRGFQEIKVSRFHDDTGRLYPKKYTWYSFLFETKSTPGP
jgi:hypothetical protein